jgi:hypothetical protein
MCDLKCVPIFLVNWQTMFFSKMITGDKTWCFQYDPESKWQGLQWKHPKSLWTKKAQTFKSQLKIVLIIFFDIRGTVHFEFVPRGQSTKLIMCRYWSSYMKLYVEKGLNFGPMIPYHDNAPAHKALSSNFWPKNRNTHPIPLIWLRKTSGYLQK